MDNMPNAKLYDELLSLTTTYLGSDADRFITEEVQNHLHKPPERLSRADLPKLIDWILAAFALLIDDYQAIEVYAAKLNNLNHKPSKQQRLNEDTL